MNIAVTMRTFDRREGYQDHIAPDEARVNYIGQTLANLERGGVFDSTLLSSFHIVDSGSKNWDDFYAREIAPNAPADKVIVETGKRTPNLNAARALRVGSDDAEAQWVLFCEDDLDCCGDFLWSIGAWLRDHENEKYRLYTFGNNGISNKDCENRTGIPLAIPCFFGTVCYAMRREDAAAMASYIEGNPFYSGGRFYGTGGVPVAHDLHYHQFHAKMYPAVTHVLCSAPSFVQHIGDQSGISVRKHLIRYESWQGRDWRYRGRKP